MDYEIVELPARTVVGLTVRASNNSPEEGAVIGQLWARFLGEGLDRSIPETRIEPYGCFALYYGYDFSDMSYDLLVGCQTDAEAPEGMARQEIPAGRYAKVEIRGGDCVTSVQEVWEAVWADEEAHRAARLHRGLRGVPARRGHGLRRHRRLPGVEIAGKGKGRNPSSTKSGGMEAKGAAVAGQQAVA